MDDVEVSFSSDGPTSQIAYTGKQQANAIIGTASQYFVN